jgi:predicted nucleic-acid-binding protein
MTGGVRVSFVDHITTYSELFLALVGVLTMLWVGTKKVYKMARNIEELVETSTANAKRLVQIEKQVHLNGGASMRDAVHRIESRLDTIEHIPAFAEALKKHAERA